MRGHYYGGRMTVVTPLRRQTPVVSGACDVFNPPYVQINSLHSRCESSVSARFSAADAPDASGRQHRRPGTTCVQMPRPARTREAIDVIHLSRAGTIARGAQGASARRGMLVCKGSCRRGDRSPSRGKNCQREPGGAQSA